METYSVRRSTKIKSHHMQVKKITFLQILIVFAACLFLKRELDLLSTEYLTGIYFPTNETYTESYIQNQAISHTIDLHRTFYGSDFEDDYDYEEYDYPEETDDFEFDDDQDIEDFEPEVYRPSIPQNKRNSDAHSKKQHAKKIDDPHFSKSWPLEKRGPYTIISHKKAAKKSKSDKKTHDDKKHLMDKLFPHEFKTEKITYKEAVTMSKQIVGVIVLVVFSTWITCTILFQAIYMCFVSKVRDHQRALEHHFIGPPKKTRCNRATRRNSSSSSEVIPHVPVAQVQAEPVAYAYQQPRYVQQQVHYTQAPQGMPINLSGNVPR